MSYTLPHSIPAPAELVAGAIALAFLAQKYWLVPLRLLGKPGQPRGESNPRRLEDGETMPDEVAEFIEARAAELSALGFSATPAIVDAGARVGLYLQRFENAPRTTIATVLVAVARRDGQVTKLFRRYVGFDSRDRIGRRVDTVGHTGAPGFPDRPGNSVVRVPEEDVELLLRLHGAHLDRSGITLTEHSVGDPVAYQRRLSDESEQWAVASGWFRDVGALRKRTLRGAFIATWRQLPPWSWIIRRREMRLWQELYGVATGADLLTAFFTAVNDEAAKERAAAGRA